MPLYAFECGSCGHAFDRLQRLADPDPDVCPQCGAQSIKRQLTAPQFRLAGSGWYETDFKKDGDKKRNLAESPDAPKTEAAKPETPKPDAPKTEAPKTESKPAESKPAPPPPAAPGATS